MLLYRSGLSAKEAAITQLCAKIKYNKMECTLEEYNHRTIMRLIQNVLLGNQGNIEQGNLK